MSFDAYHQWLGIPSNEQPVDCYRLLGVRRFEQNATVISNAAERQLLMLKSMQTGPRSAEARKLAGEVKAARLRLLDQKEKVQYDAELRKLFKDTPDHPISTLDRETGAHVEQPPVDNLAIASRSPPPSSDSTQRQQARRRSSPSHGPKRARRHAWVFAGAMVAITLTIVILWPSAEGTGISGATRFTKGQGKQNARTSMREDTTRSKARTTQRPASSVTQHGRPEAPNSQAEITDVAPQTTRPKNVESGVSRVSAEPQQAEEPSESSLGVGSASEGAAKLSLDETSRTRIREQVGNTKEASDDMKAAGAQPFAGASEEPPQDEADAFSPLPNQINLIETVATTDSGYVFLGDLAASAKTTWQVRVADYAAPVGVNRFTVRAPSNDNGIIRWPLFRTIGDTSTRSNTISARDNSHIGRCGTIEAQSRKLALSIADPSDRELIEDLSLCRLIIENSDSRHLLQLSVPQRTTPTILKFDRAKQIIPLVGLPAASSISPARLFLEVLQIDQGNGETTSRLPVQVAFAKKQTIGLNASIRSELGITLTQQDDQLCITTIPRFLRNGRKQPMVPARIQKDIARAKRQLVKTHVELNGARNILRALPSEISRVRGMVPRTPPDVVARQARLSQLAGKIDSMQSRIRRLSKVVPDVTADIQQLERVLAFANDLTGQSTLHFRVFLQGDSRDQLTLLTTSDSIPNLAPTGQ